MGKSIPTEEYMKRFVVSNSGCWEFSGCKDKNGYGIFGFKQKRAHRVSYEFHVGKIPPGMFVCHKCDNPSCINPDHLFIGTPKDNMIDKAIKGRSVRFVGENNPMAKLKDSDRLDIALLRSKGFKLKEIASKYSTTFQNVSKIIKRMNHGISK